MKTPEPLIMYTRNGCHLCEQAAALLDGAGIPWRPVDVDGEARLAELYGLRVPVLRRPDTGLELCYPFDDRALREFAGLRP